MKKCFKCGEIKELEEFYKHPQMADGHLNKCKECNKKDVRENRIIKIEHYRLYDKNRHSRTSTEQKREYRAKYPNKYKAHGIVMRAIRSGKLVAENCSGCGSLKNTHAHHDDYLKPLNIRWLCPPCHFEWHKINGEGLNG